MKVNQALVLALMAFQASAFLDSSTQNTNTNVDETGGSGGGSESTQTGGNGGSGSSSVSTIPIQGETWIERGKRIFPWDQVSTSVHDLVPGLQTRPPPATLSNHPPPETPSADAFLTLLPFLPPQTGGNGGSSGSATGTGGSGANISISADHDTKGGAAGGSSNNQATTCNGSCVTYVVEQSTGGDGGSATDDGSVNFKGGNTDASGKGGSSIAGSGGNVSVYLFISTDPPNHPFFCLLLLFTPFASPVGVIRDVVRLLS